MRNRRILMQMAGLAPSPLEKIQQRYARKLARLDREGKAQLMLVDMIQRRESGEDGMKPMPLAGVRDDDKEVL